MSSIGITTTLGNLSQTSQVASTAKAGPQISTATPLQTSATLKPDSVELSTAGQAKLLHQQGKSPALIASSLGVKIADVDGYLGIKVAAQVAVTALSSETSAKSASLPQPAADTPTHAPEAAVPSILVPQPVASQATTAKN